jgi:hypothetical protein
VELLKEPKAFLPKRQRGDARLAPRSNFRDVVSQDGVFNECHASTPERAARSFDEAAYAIHQSFRLTR